ncbi:unnamed protein product [Adineta steineri]|uniref:Condensation domain-containing protein n=1 Tax=Adineta steineri TaxID=433720 RepID=A0A814UEW4_9BILA|nr:unnamed protein product [Adineta steineri]
MANELNFYVLKTIELQGVEKLYCLHGNWSSIIHIAHFSQTNLSILKERIHYIIKQLLKKHPRLRSRIRVIRSFDSQTNNEKHLLDLFDYDEELFSRTDILQNFYSFYSGQENWMKIAENLSNENPYNKELTYIFPLFHFKLIFNENSPENSHLILLTNHSISDGQSGYIILHDYLTLATQNECVEWEINRNLSPNLIDLTEKPYTFLYPILSKLCNIVYSCQMKYLDNKLPTKSILINSNQPNDKRYPYIQPMRTHFLFTSCSNDHYEHLRSICHKQNLTLHGPLFACLILTIQYLFFPKFKRDILMNFDISIDYNMRNRLLLNNYSLKEIVGFYIGVNSIDLSDISVNMNFWSLANYCSKETNKKLSDGEVSFNTHIFSNIINDDKNDFFHLMGKSSDGCLSEMNYSNLGKYPYDITQYKNVNLDGIHLINNSSIYYSSTIIYLTCVKQIDISLAHRFEHHDKAREFLYLYKNLIELSIDFHMNTTIQDIFDLLNKTTY